MATANTVQLQVGQWPEYYRPGISDESTKKASQLLQENHDKHHIFFNEQGFHNHIVHHMLTLWALNASPAQIEREYSTNKSYQRPIMGTDSKLQTELQDPKVFIDHLGPEKYYHDFLTFFKTEIDKTSWQEVLQKYLLAGDERAETMLARMYAGFLHPLIHLGFGIEFQQPAIIAESLAEAACHSDEIGALLLPAEKLAKTQTGAGSKSIVQLLDEVHCDALLRDAVKYSDSSKIVDGLVARASERTIHYIAQIRVNAEDLEEKTAEMISATNYFTGGAQRPDRAVKFDFFMLHSLNASIFFSAFLKQDWLSEANKIRLLEWKIRADLIMYASRKSPAIYLDEIRNYQPKQPSGWEEVEDRVCSVDDDGHASKLVRAIAHGARVSRPYEDKEAFRLKGDDWLQLAHMAIDSVEMPGEMWVRSAGFDEAWKDVPLRANL